MYTCLGEMPIDTARGFEYLVNELRDKDLSNLDGSDDHERMVAQQRKMLDHAGVIG